MIQLKSAELFDDLEEEQGKDIKDFKVEGSNDIEELLEKYQACYEYRKHGSFLIPKMFVAYREIIGREYQSASIYQFSNICSQMLRGEYFGHRERYGIFLSALASLCSEDEVHIENNDYKPERLGIFNKDKIINVHGDVGVYCGYDMKGGKLIVDGNARDVVGCGLKGGLIIIKKSANNSLGRGMEGGKIIVSTAGVDVGENAKNGEIRILEGYRSLSYTLEYYDSKTKVFHKGNLLHPKPNL